jgi:tetratricopeptide (TPR) repeat protein
MAPGAFMGIHFDRGQALFALQRYQEAVVEYQAELAQEPGCVYSKANIASCLINLGKFSDARAAVQDTLSQAPDYGFAFYLLSFLEPKGGAESPALRAINEAVRLEPTVVRNVARLGWLLRDQGRHGECLETTTRALELNPRHIDTLVLRAKTLEALGQPDDAAATLRAALAIDPEDPDAHLALGNVALACGDPGEALDALREARRISPVKHNNREKILDALARRIWPFRQIDVAVLRYQRMGPALRWALSASAFSALLLLHAAVKPTARVPSAGTTILYVLLANSLLLVIIAPQYSKLVVRMVSRRELDLRWRDVVKQNFDTILRLAISHWVVSIIAIIMSFAPGFAYALFAMTLAKGVLKLAPARPEPRTGRAFRRGFLVALLFLCAPLIVHGGVAFSTYDWLTAAWIWAAVLGLSGFSSIWLQRLAGAPRG